jgi:hypothetical protein
LLAALVLLAVPNLGPGYGSQYVYWFLPLLTICYLSFPMRWWRVLLMSTWLIVIATYLVEYGLFKSHGALLLALRPGDAHLKELSQKLSTPAAQTMVRLPMFLAYLLVLACGVRLLRSDVDLRQTSSVNS